jgi:hypothetical protein
MTDALLLEYLKRSPTPPDVNVRQAIDGPIDPADALGLTAVDRLLDPAPLPRESGWCTLADGVGYVAVRTRMPRVNGEMVDWWFDWHPRESLRYRIWHPTAHRANVLREPSVAGAKAHWGAVHHPVEDIGTGVVHARIEFKAPRQMGMSTDALEDRAVATIVCGEVGDDRLHVRHSSMFHVFLREGDGVVLRSHFWLGASIRPYGALAAPGERLLNRALVRRVALPRGLPRALATHCAEEYSNLAALLPEVYERFGPGA